MCIRDRNASEAFFGFIPGSVGETSFLAILIGAAILILSGIGSWRIILFTFLGGYLTALLFNLWGVNALMSTPAHIHLIIGGFAFGAVFMATDPVTATQTNQGKIIYGLLVGFFAIVIRVLNPAVQPFPDVAQNTRGAVTRPYSFVILT